MSLYIESTFKPKRFKKQDELKVRHAGGEPKIYSPAKPGRSNHQSGIAYDLGNADYVETPYVYAKLPSEGMDAGRKKVDKWLRNNARKYGFVLPLRMTNERHHWEYVGVEKTKSMDTYIDFNIGNMKDREGNDATAPKKNESFSLRRTNLSDRKVLYMMKEKD